MSLAALVAEPFAALKSALAFPPRQRSLSAIRRVAR